MPKGDSSLPVRKQLCKQVKIDFWVWAKFYPLLELALKTGMGKGIISKEVFIYINIWFFFTTYLFYLICFSFVGSHYIHFI